MIVIPMAGLSSRFFKAGYNKPKYMLEAHGQTLFDHAVKSFESYFETEKFLFIVRDVQGTLEFVKSRIMALGIINYHICALEDETRGQAETVAVGLKYIDYDGSLTIFNIDTFRPKFSYPNLKDLGDGYLEVFKGEGDNWSFVELEHENSNAVIRTTEKEPISNLCCTGLYHFKSCKDFIAAYNYYCSRPVNDWDKGELYVAPLYNYLISKNKNIMCNVINRDDVIFCGIPDEYIEFIGLDNVK